MAKRVKMRTYKHLDSDMTQLCAEGRLDNHPRWRRMGRFELFLEDVKMVRDWLKSEEEWRYTL